MTKTKPPECFDAPANMPAGVLELQAEAVARDGAHILGFDDPVVRAQMPIGVAQELQRYVERNLKPGGFVAAMLVGDFELAEKMAIDGNENAMPVIAYWLWRYAPVECFGSLADVHSWTTSDGHRGQS